MIVLDLHAARSDIDQSGKNQDDSGLEPDRHMDCGDTNHIVGLDDFNAAPVVPCKDGNVGLACIPHNGASKRSFIKF